MQQHIVEPFVKLLSGKNRVRIHQLLQLLIQVGNSQHTPFEGIERFIAQLSSDVLKE